jgi:hypothetical protein
MNLKIKLRFTKILPTSIQRGCNIKQLFWFVHRPRSMVRHIFKIVQKVHFGNKTDFFAIKVKV